MAVDFGKVTVNALYSEDARHSNQRDRFSPNTFEFSPDECVTATLGLTTSPKYLAWDTLGSSVNLLAVKNPGAVDVKILYWSLSSTTVLTIAVELTFSNSAKTIVGSGGTPDLSAIFGIGGYVLLSGSNLNSGNAGPFLVTNVNSTTITVAPGETLVDESAITEVTMKDVRKNFQLIPPGGIFVTSEAMNSQPILGISTSGDTEIEFILMGA